MNITARKCSGGKENCKLVFPLAVIFRRFKGLGLYTGSSSSYWKIPTASTGTGLYSPSERNGKSEMSMDICLLSCIHLITCPCSMTASGSLVNQKF